MLFDSIFGLTRQSQMGAESWIRHQLLSHEHTVDLLRMVHQKSRSNKNHSLELGERRREQHRLRSQVELVGDGQSELGRESLQPVHKRAERCVERALARSARRQVHAVALAAHFGVRRQDISRVERAAASVHTTHRKHIHQGT